MFSCIRFGISKNILAKQGFHTLGDFLRETPVLLGQLLVPFAVLIIFYLSGYYNTVFRKSRMQEFITTFISTFLAALIFFFAILLNDSINERMFNYEMFLWEWVCLFIPTFIIRNLITLDATKKIQGRKWNFETLIIGNDKEAHKFACKLDSMDKSLGYEIKGFVNIPGEKELEDVQSSVYELNQLETICKEQNIKELLIIPTKHNIRSISNVLNILYPLNLPIRLSPNLFHILLTNVRLSNFTGEPLINVAGSSMSESSINIKRVSDIILSALFLIIFFPIYLLIGLAIRIDSKGPVIYKQERIGYRNIPFNILKFRTMRQDAEKEGVPLLSSQTDDRVTNIGKFLRKYRLDELPQFWNVLIGEMSIIGPRPERKYFIDQIMKYAPYYALVHQVRPGLTSMGMVKYGYATSVKEMVERLKYDLLYLENMSLMNDMKIMVYTVKTVLSGKGL